MGTRQQFEAATGAAAPMCAMRTPIMCQKVSNCPHLYIGPTSRAPGWQRRPHARLPQDRRVLANSLDLLRGPPHPCARCAHRKCARKCQIVRVRTLHSPGARASGSGVLTRGCSRTDGYSPTFLLLHWGRRLLCSMRSPILSPEVSNRAHLHIAPTGRARRWQQRPHARAQRDSRVLVKKLLPERMLPYSWAQCAHRHSARMCRNGRICKLPPSAARAGGSGVRTHGCSRTDGYSPTVSSRYRGCRSHVRDAHTDNVPKSVDVAAFAHCTHRPRDPVAATSARVSLGAFNQSKFNKTFTLNATV